MIYQSCSLIKGNTSSQITYIYFQTTQIFIQILHIKILNFMYTSLLYNRTSYSKDILMLILSFQYTIIDRLILKLTYMNILDKIIDKNLFWSLPNSRLPENIRQYKCQMVIDQVKTQENNIIQHVYLRFIHPITSSTFQVGIDRLNAPSSSIYEAEINTDNIEEPTTTLIGQYDSICFTTVRNYTRPQLKIKEIEFNEDSPYHSEDQICTYFDLDSANQDEDDYDEYSLIDYSAQNQKQVKHKVLMFLKNPDNRFKKMKQIKNYLKKIKFNVPDHHLKNILINYCGTHIMNKKKGFLVHQDYLSIEEKHKRKLEEQDYNRKEKEKEIKKTQRKKTNKKQIKIEKPGKKKLQITNDDIQQYANSNNSKQTKGALDLLNKQSKSKVK